MYKNLFLAGLFMLILNHNLPGQSIVEQQKLTLEELFASPKYAPAYYPEVKWIEGGEFFLTWQASETIQGAADLVLHDSRNNRTSIFLPAESLIPPGAEKPLLPEQYELAPGEKKMLIFTNTEKVWRHNTRGDYYFMDLKSKKLQKLGKGLPASSLMFAKFSPGNEQVAYVSNSNIYLEDLGSGEIRQLTSDGNGDIINGTFDWAYEEEFFSTDGFRWSPDGKQLAFWQIDATNIPDFLMIDNLDSVYSGTVPVQYPKAGFDPSAAKIGVIDINSGNRTWLKIPGDPVQHYLPRMQWIGNQLLVQQLNRRQNEYKLFLANPTTGEARLVYQEKDPAWVDLFNLDLASSWEMKDLPVIDQGKAIIRETEKDGWRHLYRIDLASGKETLLTPGAYDVAAFLSMQGEQNLLIQASPENATQRYLYKVKMADKDKPVRLTPENFAGVNLYDVSPDGKYAIHTFSNANTPPEVNLIRTADHKILAKLETNQQLQDQLADLPLQKAEFFKVTTADGVEMDGYMLKPQNFDPGKRYPVVFYVYGEPAGQEATDSWQGLWPHFLSQEGFIYLILDNRGTPSLKGREWRKSIYAKIGVMNSRDQAMAAREIMKWDFVDPERISIWGWSGGGATTLNAMFRYPEIYNTGIAVAAVSDLHLYDNIYQERYMGLPRENEAAYFNGSPVNFAENLEGNLLVIHGTGDDNVHYQNAEVLVDALVAANKQFSFMAYPNRSHAIYERKNTRLHLYSLMFNYLKNHNLPAAEDRL